MGTPRRIGVTPFTGSWAYAAFTLLGALSTAANASVDDARHPDEAPALEQAKAATPYKLTSGHYRFDDRSPGTDINLRRSFDWGNSWLGYYRDPSFGEQWRVGADGNLRPWSDLELSIQPSAQLAGRGFAGGSVTVEYGVPWFVSGSIGRTNLKPYWNLNFDPNDAVSAAAGYRGGQGATVYLQVIRDDRLGTGQQHVHAVARLPVRGRERITIDLLRKQGLADDEYVRAWGLAIGYDWPRYFIRVARDPKVNFSPSNVTRINFGFRF